MCVTLPSRLEGPLPRDQFMSFFSVLKHAFEPLNDKKCELGKVSSPPQLCGHCVNLDMFCPQLTKLVRQILVSLKHQHMDIISVVYLFVTLFM